MKAKNIILLSLLVWVISFVFCVSAWALSAFSVAGTVRNGDGSLAEDGLTVVVVNEMQNLNQTTTTGGEIGVGKYAVAFVGVDEEGNTHTVAEIGDVLKITVKDAKGKELASRTHTVTEADISAGRAVVQDIVIGPTKGPGIASVLEDTGGKWKKAGNVISITVTQEEDGKEAVGGSFNINERIINQKLFDDGKNGGDEVAKDKKWTGKYTVVDGDYVVGKPVIATLMDAEGYVTSKESATKVNIDAVPPESPTGLTVTGAIINVANSKSVEIACQVTANASAIVVLKDEAAKTVEKSGKADTKGAFKVNVDASALADGTITVEAFEEDEAGNRSKPTEISVLKDTVPPPAPTALKITGGVINQANETAVEATCKATAGVSVTVKLQEKNEKTVEKSNKVDADGSFKIEVDASSLSDGAITVIAFETPDEAGNPGATATISVPKDTTSTPPLTELNITGGVINQANETEVEVTCKATADASVTITLQDKNEKTMEKKEKVKADGSFKTKVDASSLSDGDITVTAFEEDAAGNSSEPIVISVPKDTIPPDPPAELNVTGGVINQANVTAVEVTGKATAGASVTIRLKDKNEKAVEKKDKVNDDGSFLIKLDTSSLEDGDITVIAFEATDAAGNPGEKATISVKKDTIPPPPPTELKVTGDIINQANETEVEVTCKATAGAFVTIRLQDTKQNTAEKKEEVNADGSFKIKLDASDLLDGEITVIALEDADAAGNRGSEATTSVQKDTGIFRLESPAPFQETTAGESAVYIITVEGKEDFDADISLIAKDHPSGVTWRFNPEVIKPGQGSQLTVTTPENLTEDTYEFLVLGLSENLYAQLPLTLTILPSEPSYITASLEPEGMGFGDEVKISGEVILPGAEDSERTGLLVTINLTSPEEEITTLTTITDKGKYSIELTIDEKFLVDWKLNKSPIGKWYVKTEWGGKGNYKPAVSSEEAFTVTKGTSEIKWETFPEKARLGDKMTIVGRLYPNLEGQKISLGIKEPDGMGSKVEETTDNFGIFQYEVEFYKKDHWAITANWSGNDLYKLCSHSDDVDVVEELGKAIIVLGGGRKNKEWENFNKTANYVYEILKKRKLEDKDIYYMNPSQEQKRGIEVDFVTSKKKLEDAITDWAKERVNANIPLFIYLMSHNVKDTFLLEKHGDDKVYLKPKELANWLDALQAATGVKEVTIIIEACEAGNFIEPLIKEGRTVITSTDDRSAAVVGNSSFSRYFYDNIYLNYSVRDAFRLAKETMRALPYYRHQEPQLEANNVLPPNQAADYAAVEDRFIPADIPTAEEKIIEFLDVSPPQEISLDKHSAFLWAKIAGADGVWGEIVPPDYVPPQPTSTFETPGADFETVEFQYNVDEERYECTYDKFSQPGVYTVVIYAENIGGELASISQKLLAPTVTVIPSWDVNSDGIVDILDLVVAGKSFGESPPTDSRADVNRDGTVDISDLVLVGKHFGESTKEVPAAP